jgi:sarcosine oxidase subunit alpha
VLGLYDHQLAVALETVDDGTVRERLWKIRAERIILATGAIERPMLFPDNDRPGVMLASAVERYATHFGVACGKRIVISTACDSGYDVAASLNAAGIEVAAIVDSRETNGRAAPMGVKVFLGSSIVAVSGSRAINRVTVAANRGGEAQAIAADCVASAGGWTPAVNLYSMAGGKLRWNDDASMFVPDLPLKGIESVGACAGAFVPPWRRSVVAPAKYLSICKTMYPPMTLSSPHARTIVPSNTSSVTPPWEWQRTRVKPAISMRWC